MPWYFKRLTAWPIEARIFKMARYLNLMGLLEKRPDTVFIALTAANWLRLAGSVTCSTLAPATSRMSGASARESGSSTECWSSERPDTSRVTSFLWMYLLISGLSSVRISAREMRKLVMIACTPSKVVEGVAVSARTRNDWLKRAMKLTTPTYAWLPVARWASSITIQAMDLGSTTPRLRSLSTVCGVAKKTRLVAHSSSRIMGVMEPPIRMLLSERGRPVIPRQASNCCDTRGRVGAMNIILPVRVQR